MGIKISTSSMSSFEKARKTLIKVSEKIIYCMHKKEWKRGGGWCPDKIKVSGMRGLHLSLVS